MGMVAPQQRIASAFFVFFGDYGDVSRYAQERGVCRQWVYREAACLQDFLSGEQQRRRVEVSALRQQQLQWKEQRELSVVMDEEKQAWPVWARRVG